MFQISPFRSFLCLGPVLTQVGALGSALLSTISALAQAALQSVVCGCFRRSPIVDDARNDRILWGGSGGPVEVDELDNALSVLSRPGARLADEGVWGAITILKHGRDDGSSVLPDHLSPCPEGLSIDEQIRHRLDCIKKCKSVYSHVIERLESIEQSIKAHSNLADRCSYWLFPGSSLGFYVRDLINQLRSFQSERLCKDLTAFQTIADSLRTQSSQVNRGQIDNLITDASKRGDIPGIRLGRDLLELCQL
jgi:hypothetical protein